MLNVILNILLFIFKFIGGMITGSVSVIADAFNNITDAGITLAAYLGLKISSMGPGEHHPNGHGRFEWVIALLSSTCVMLIGWELGKDSLEAMSKSQISSDISAFAIIVLIVSIIVKMFMYFYNTRLGKINESESYKAIAVDSICDAVSTSAVLFSLLLYKYTGINIDGWCGFIVSIIIIYNGFNSFCETASRIMGRSPSKEELENMRSFIMQNEDFKEIHDLQIEDYGYGRHRVSMIAVGKIKVNGDKLINDVAQATSAVYEKFGYNVLIALEKPVIDKNEEFVINKINTILSNEDIPIKLLSIRISDAVNKKMLHIEIGVPHECFNKFHKIENNINKELECLRKEYAIILKVVLTREHIRHRHLS